MLSLKCCKRKKMVRVTHDISKDPCSLQSVQGWGWCPRWVSALLVQAVPSPREDLGTCWAHSPRTWISFLVFFWRRGIDQEAERGSLEQDRMTWHRTKSPSLHSSSGIGTPTFKEGLVGCWVPWGLDSRTPLECMGPSLEFTQSYLGRE